MKTKFAYAYFTKWIIVTMDDELVIIHSNEKEEFVKKFEKKIIMISNIKKNSCCVYCDSGYFYVNLISFQCKEFEKKDRKMNFIGTLKDQWDIFKKENSEYIFAFDKKTNYHSLLTHSKDIWIIKHIDHKLKIIEADEKGIYICGKFYKYDKQIKVEKNERY
jgi:hypothetical protein